MGTIQDRGYVWKKGSALVPSFTAFSVVGLLEQHFPDMVDYAFTARMEDDLDSIAAGSAEAIPWLARFYFGEQDDAGLKTKVDERLAEIDARAINSIPIGVDENGVGVVGRVGRYGPYLERGEDRASIPDDIPPDELTIERAIELIEAPSGDRELGVHPETELPVMLKNGRFGPYVQMGEHDDETGEKPKTSSLFSTMDPDTLDLDQAIRLLSLPRTIGTDPADNVEILALNGRYGPYVKKGSDSRSLETEDQLFTVTLEDALARLAQPRQRGGRQAKPPLREMGTDPVSEKPMVVKDGRFGPYVTDGEANASLRKGDDVETLTDERASELLQMRRDRGPVKKKKAGAKKKATKKKKAAKKKTSATKKKTAARKKTAASKKKAPAAEKTEAVESTENPDQ
jgi:DNA topoisomerase-1